LGEPPVLEAVRVEVTRESRSMDCPGYAWAVAGSSRKSRRFDGDSGPRPTAISSTVEVTRRIAVETQPTQPDWATAADRTLSPNLEDP
jgi:hypothetical protein